jgi:hypothetical protein
MASARRQHVQQVGAYRFLAGLGTKRSATVVPAPLRHWHYKAPGPVAVGLTLLFVAGWLVVFGVVGGWSELRSEIPLATVAGFAVLVLNVGRVTVSDHGLSFDVAGTRSDSARVVPLVAVREVRTMPLPADWPRATRRGGWWFGRTRVGVRHLQGDEEQALTLWVRDPAAFADALGARLATS